MKSVYVNVNCRKFKGQDPLPTLSMEDARQKVSQLLTDHLQLKVEGYAADTQTICDVLVKASVEGKAIEGTCNDLEAAPTGHTVRTSLNDQLKPADLSDIEKQVNAALTADVPYRVWRKRRNVVMDLHDEPFYGKSPELMPYACRGEAQKGTTYFYRVASLYVIFHDVPVTLAVTFVLPNDTQVTVLKRLLGRARRTGLFWRCLLLDKGFCNIPVITYLQQARFPAVIACPIRGKQKGTRALCVGKASYLTTHQFKSAPHGARRATLAVVRCFSTSRRRQVRKKARWLIYVVVNLSWQPDQIHQCYRRRFGIESSYRCMRHVHATTTSRNAAVRFFLIALGFVLVNVWITLRWRLCQIPRRGGRLIDRKRLELQRLAHFLVRAIEQVYGTVTVICATARPIDP
jgi:putative transposase